MDKQIEGTDLFVSPVAISFERMVFEMSKKFTKAELSAQTDGGKYVLSDDDLMGAVGSGTADGPDVLAELKRRARNALHSYNVEFNKGTGITISMDWKGAKSKTGAPWAATCNLPPEILNDLVDEATECGSELRAQCREKLAMIQDDASGVADIRKEKLRRAKASAFRALCGERKQLLRKVQSGQLTTAKAMLAEFDTIHPVLVHDQRANIDLVADDKRTDKADSPDELPAVYA